MTVNECECGPDHKEGQDGPGKNEDKDYCFELDGQKYPVDQHKVTPQQIRDRVGNIPSNVAIVEVFEDGTQRVLPEGEEVRLEKCTKIRKLPRFTRGRVRVASDLQAVRREYAEVQIGPNDEYFVVPAFELPAGIFTTTNTDLLVVIPPTYPTAPPDNFHVIWGLALKSGQPISNYSGPTTLYGRAWGTFSHHVATDTWDGGSGDSFLNFIATVRARLQEGA